LSNLDKPRNLALIIALGSAIISFVVAFVIDFEIKVIWKILALLVFSFGFIYVLTIYLIKKFVFDRIRLIYKKVMNLDSEAAKNIPFSYLSDNDPLENVNDTVSDWLKVQGAQITVLKKQEEFRREFIGNIAHELKTPIFSMQGYVHTLLDGGLEDESINRKYLLRASYSIERMIGIVNDLDTITRLDSKVLQLEYSDFDIVELTKEVIQGTEIQAQDQAITVKVAYKSDQTIKVHADKDKISQVLTNLVINAIKYGNSGGYVSIEFHDLDELILVEVIDNGPGIESEHIPRLFERFYRVDKHRSRQVGGSGLGLAIVKHIIEAHYQKINVRSKVGLGSTFSFTLKKADN
jgi:two-component system phosphate regulon sensor histidine kinase PhoR